MPTREVPGKVGTPSKADNCRALAFAIYTSHEEVVSQTSVFVEPLSGCRRSWFGRFLAENLGSLGIFFSIFQGTVSLMLCCKDLNYLPAVAVEGPVGVLHLRGKEATSAACFTDILP